MKQLYSDKDVFKKMQNLVVFYKATLKRFVKIENDSTLSLLFLENNFFLKLKRKKKYFQSPHKGLKNYESSNECLSSKKQH